MAGSRITPEPDAPNTSRFGISNAFAEAGMEPFGRPPGRLRKRVGAGTIIELFKAKVIYKDGPWRGLEDVEFANMTWVAWFNTQRLLEPLDYVPSAVYEEQFYRAQAIEVTAGALNEL